LACWGNPRKAVGKMTYNFWMLTWHLYRYFSVRQENWQNMRNSTAEFKTNLQKGWSGDRGRKRIPTCAFSPLIKDTSRWPDLYSSKYNDLIYQDNLNHSVERNQVSPMSHTHDSWQNINFVY
jgi:hypothetical protein